MHWANHSLGMAYTDTVSPVHPGDDTKGNKNSNHFGDGYCNFSHESAIASPLSRSSPLRSGAINLCRTLLCTLQSTSFALSFVLCNHRMQL